MIGLVASVSGNNAEARVIPGKLNVCTVTINSSDEREVFKAHLPSSRFQFIELTSFGDEISWFDKACEKGVQCDVLMISGHFGGEFFGKSKYSLSLSELEKHSCRKTCDGILKSPKEVFLMGCNTLAGKERDRRTPEEYGQVLIRDRFGAHDIARLTQVRYGPLGDSFKGQMQRVFSGVPHIYGFDSIGPAGNTIRPMLTRYFKTKPDYAKHLSEIVAAPINTALADALHDTAYVECKGLYKGDPASALAVKICELHDDRRSFSARVASAGDMLRGADYLALFPAVSAFLNKELGEVDVPTLTALRRLGADPAIATKLDELFEKLEGSSAMQIDIIGINRLFGRVSKTQADMQVDKILRPYLRNITVQNADAVCAMSREHGSQIEIKKEDFDPTQIPSEGFIRLLTCTKTKDTRLTAMVLTAFNTTKRYAVDILFDVLAELPGYEKEKLDVARKFYQADQSVPATALSAKIVLAKSPDANERLRAFEIILKSRAAQTLAKVLKESGVRDDRMGRSVIKILDRTLTDRSLAIDADVGDYTGILVNSIAANSPVWREIFAAQFLTDKEYDRRSELLESIHRSGMKNAVITQFAVSQLAVVPDGESVSLTLITLLKSATLDQASIAKLVQLAKQTVKTRRSLAAREILIARRVSF